MFLKSPHKFTFASLTFALVLSTNLLFSGESFAGPDEDFVLGHTSFIKALEEKKLEIRSNYLDNADRRFLLAFNDYAENSLGQAKTKLFWARAIALRDGTLKAKPMFDEAVEHYRVAEKDAPIKDGLADALFYRAENNLAIEALKKEEAAKINEVSNSKKRKLAYASAMHEEAKVSYEESLNLPQTHELKIRTGGKLAYLWAEDKDNQKAKDTLLKIVNVMSDSNLRAGTQKEIIDFCLELEGKTEDANYQSAKDALVKIVDEIEDIQFKAETQKRIGEFFYTVKDLPNTISYLTKARDYFARNTAWIGYTPIDAKAVGEINTILQHAKFLTGLYDQSVTDGLAAEQWIKASVQSSEDLQEKQKFNIKLLANLHLLGNSYLKLHENDSRLDNIKNAESTFYALDNLLITFLKSTEENQDVSQSLFLDAESLKKLSENSDYVDLLYAYQIRTNIGLMYTKIHQNNYAGAASNLRLAEEKVKLLNGYNDRSNIIRRVTRSELAVDMARLNLRMFETHDKVQEQRVIRLKDLVSRWSGISREDIAPYYAPRHLWRLEMTLGDASLHMNDIEAAKGHYIAAITEARKAGYKHFEMLARNQLALTFDMNIKAESEVLVSLENELKTLNTEKATLVKEAAAFKKAKSDQEESKNAEITAKEAVIKEKEAPIASLKATIAGFTANRNRESGIADKLKLFCELRARGYFESNAAYSEDEQKLYLTYLGEAPVLNVLNSSQVVDNYQDIASDNGPKENLAKVVEELKETLVLPDESSNVRDDLSSEDILSQEPVLPLDLFSGNIFDASTEESDEIDENSSKMTDFVNQLAQVYEERSLDESDGSLTNDFPDITALGLFEQPQYEDSLPSIEDLGNYLDVETNVQLATVLGSSSKEKPKSKALKNPYTPAMQRAIDKKRGKKKSNNRR